MKLIKVFTLIVFLMSFILVNNSFGLRCNGKLISVGDSKIQVLKVCGQPVIKERIKVLRTDFPGRKEYIWVEAWSFNFGPKRFMVIINFKNGRVSSISEMDYGF